MGVKLFSEKDLVEKAKKSITSILSGIPFFEIKGTKSSVIIENKKFDLVIDVFTFSKQAKFIVEIKSQGEPRFVRMAVAELKDSLKKFRNSYGIVIAPYLSDNSRQVCMEAGIGCLDIAGNALLSFKNFFIDIRGRPNPFTSVRFSKSVFSPKSSRILRVFLSAPSKGWYVRDLSKEACISIGLTSRVKNALISEELIKQENKSLYLVKPEELLKQWADNYSYEKNQIFSFYSGLSEEQLETTIKKECEKRRYNYGLALFTGARKVAPFVRFMRFFSYVDGDIEGIADDLQMKSVVSGANVILLRPYDDGVFYDLQNIKGINIVSDIQLYIDLKSYKGRGEEAAQTIFEQRIKPKW
jgi:hypothetical protein